MLTPWTRAHFAINNALHRAIFRASMWYSPEFPAESPQHITLALGAVDVRWRSPGEVVVYLPRWQQFSPLHKWTAQRYLDRNLEMGVAWEVRFDRPPARIFDLGKERRKRNRRK